MNFGPSESFVVRHKYIFDNYEFKIIGLESKDRIEFDKIIKQLSGKIKGDADYIMTTPEYYYRNQSSIKKSAYNLMFIGDSIAAKKPLDINEYRLTENDEYCCLTAHYFKKISCCNLLNKNNKENESVNGSEKGIMKWIKTRNMDDKKRKLSPEKTILNRDSENECLGTKKSRKSPSQKVSRRSLRSVTKKSKLQYIDSASSAVSLDNEDDKEILPNISTRSMRQKPSKADTRKRKSSSEWEISSSSDSEEESSTTIKHKTSLSQKVTQSTIKSTSSSSVISLDSEDELKSKISSISIGQQPGSKVDWWLKLPKTHKPDSDYVEPSRERERRQRGGTFKDHEKMLMITYLVVTNQCHLWASRKPFAEMHKKGYLLHRSVESMSNNFRKVTMPKIRQFGLPEAIIEKFFDT